MGYVNLVSYRSSVWIFHHFTELSEFEIREITHLQSSAFSQKMYLCLF